LENLELRNDLSYTLGIAHTKHELGRVTRLTGEFDNGRKHLEEAIQITENLPDNPGALMADLHDLGCLELDLATEIYKLENFSKAQLHFKEAKQHFERSLKIARGIKNKLAITTKLYELGRHAGFTKRFAAAENYLNECLEIRQSLEDKYGISQAFQGQAEVAIEAALFQSKRENKSELNS
jgi:tetratricopeptide (TPR) repeat protein